MEQVKLNAGGIAVAHRVGDALHGDFSEGVRHGLVFRQHPLDLHRHIQALKGLLQQCQAAGRGGGIVLAQGRGEAAGKVRQKGHVRLPSVPQGPEQQADALAQQVMDPALAAGNLLCLADGLEMSDGMAQLPAPLF
ncbi:hypothetical protein DWX58_00875 [Pseudoflavonifractor sp. AF19-9AC]|nr:hypothetical protein DWX58_00875 [Pseudoflavonifractor sp. AF19-9AC]